MRFQQSSHSFCTRAASIEWNHRSRRRVRGKPRTTHHVVSGRSAHLCLFPPGKMASTTCGSKLIRALPPPHEPSNFPQTTKFRNSNLGWSSEHRSQGVVVVLAVVVVVARVSKPKASVYLTLKLRRSCTESVITTKIVFCRNQISAKSYIMHFM